MNYKIFGIGLPKTGTSSLHAALEILGYRSVHYPVTWSEIASHDAACDISVACRFAKLDQLYPGSKFILTLRELNEWIESCEYHFGQKVKPSELAPKLREFLLIQRVKAFGTTYYDTVLFKEAYYRHKQHIQDYFAHRPQDLLILNIGSGKEWEQLCPFLGNSIPELPFVHKNIAGESLALMFQDMTLKIEQNLDDLLN